MTVTIAATLLAVLIAPAAGPAASAAPAAEPAWSLDNPFCDVLASVVPSEKGGDYGLVLFTRTGIKVEAHVTLVGDGAAYDAHVPAANLEGDMTDRHTAAVIVRFPSATPLRYFFIDSYSIDGAPWITCPSYVFRSGSGPNDDPMTGLGLTVVTPVVLQQLPPLPCGKIYTEPGIKKGFEPVVGSFGNRPHDVVLHVYVDSNGSEVRASVRQSSGIEGLDDAAMGGVQWTRYSPATFLCTPVVGELDMIMEYRP
jgi:TonB family protein